MLLTSDVVEPPRIAIRVGIRFVCLSSSLFIKLRLRRTSATTIGCRRAFRTSDCKVVASDAIEISIQAPRLVIKGRYLREVLSGWASCRRSATVEQVTIWPGEIDTPTLLSARAMNVISEVESQFFKS